MIGQRFHLGRPWRNGLVAEVVSFALPQYGLVQTNRWPSRAASQTPSPEVLVLNAEPD